MISLRKLLFGTPDRKYQMHIKRITRKCWRGDHDFRFAPLFGVKICSDCNCCECCVGDHQ